MKDDFGELWQMITAYFKQETLEPIKALGRYLLWGMLGSFAFVLGIGVLLLGLLRLLQDQTGTVFSGHLSWIPYLLCAVASTLVCGAGVVGILRTKKLGDKERAQKAAKAS
jgi:hypothetical protein